MIRCEHNWEFDWPWECVGFKAWFFHVAYTADWALDFYDYSDGVKYPAVFVGRFHVRALGIYSRWLVKTTPPKSEEGIRCGRS